MNNQIIRKIFCDDEHTNRKRLFEKALTSAKSGKVLYIMCNELNELPQLSQEVTSLNRHYMKMISFLYAKDVDSLVESLCSLPDWQSVPSTIILDELNSYCSVENLSDACAIISLILDSIASCSKVLKTPCAMYVSITKNIINEEYCNVLRELYFE